MKGLIIFGSRSDEFFYKNLLEEVKNVCDTEFYILSAHRNPDELEALLKSKTYDFIIAGAGLAAHLPGVVASKVKCPVFGLPVNSQFSGLDAFLSIVQMPGGVPVLCEKPNSFNATLDFLESWQSRKGSSCLNFVLSEEQKDNETIKKVIEKAKVTATELNVELSFSNNVQENLINAILIEESKFEMGPKDSIYIPIISKSEVNDPETVLKFMSMANQGGLWVGVNNSKNAVTMFNKLNKGL